MDKAETEGVPGRIHQHGPAIATGLELRLARTEFQAPLDSPRNILDPKSR
jgi:hypothetical protein